MLICCSITTVSTRAKCKFILCFLVVKLQFFFFKMAVAYPSICPIICNIHISVKSNFLWRLSHWVLFTVPDQKSHMSILLCGFREYIDHVSWLNFLSCLLCDADHIIWRQGYSWRCSGEVWLLWLFFFLYKVEVVVVFFLMEMATILY